MEHSNASQDSNYEQSHKKHRAECPNGYNSNPDTDLNNTTYINQNELLFVLIKTTDLDDPLCLTRIDPWDLGEELERILGSDVKAAKTTKAGNILVGVETQEQYDKLFKLEVFFDKNVTVEPADLVGTVRGVLADRRLIDKSEEYILDKLKTQGVVRVRRIETTTSDGIKQKLNGLRFGFSREMTRRG